MRVSDIAGKRKIDLNVDIGEGAPFDDELLTIATSANIGCGVHAGSFPLTVRTIEKCRSLGVRFGVHPGYPDRENMGRSPISDATERTYLDSIFIQMKTFIQTAPPAYVKPHGAFYNDTAISLPTGWDAEIAGRSPYESSGKFLAQYPGVHSLMMLLKVYRLPLMGLDNTAHRVVASRAKQAFIREGFADRRYQSNGLLVPRSKPGALLTETSEIREQVLRLAPKVDSICLHGDNPGCVEFALFVRKTLTENGYEVGF